MSIVIALLVFGFLILIHELGHFTMARVFKVGVREFSIGMGPQLIAKTSNKSGTKYALRLLPIGGYVSMEGEDEDSPRGDALNNKPIWQRLLIMIAGSFMNLLSGLLITLLLVAMMPSLHGTTVESFSSEAITTESGLAVGDTIYAVNGVRVYTSYDLSYTIMHEGVKPIEVTVLREGKKVVLSDVVFPTVEAEGVAFGAPDFYVRRVEKNLGNALTHALSRSVTSIRMIWESLFDLFTGRYGLDQLSGPVGITTQIGDAASANDGGISLLSLASLIALNLGVMNLLPLPALDGGRVLFLLIEAVTRKPIKREVEGYIHFIGLALLLLLMLFVTFKDITRLIG